MKKYSILIIVIMVAILIASPASTYLIAKCFKNQAVISPIGSVDTWISFAGSIIGGSITMIALYFTIKQEHIMIKKNTELSVMPSIYCELQNNIISNNTNDKELVIDDCINNWGFINWDMINSSDNLANNVRIVDQFYYLPKPNSKEKAYIQIENLDEYGISLYTILYEDSIFIPPHNKQSWKSNFMIEPNDDGTYKFGGPAFIFKHAIIYKYTDVLESREYTGRFEFEFNINVDTENKLHFHLWDSSNRLINKK